MTVFDRVKHLSKRHSKTIKQVAADLGYSENYFYSIKSGKQPTAERLQQIADYFRVSTDYLLGRTDNPNVEESSLPEYEEKLLLMFRKGEQDIPEEKRDIYRKQALDMMNFISNTMKELDENNKPK